MPRALVTGASAGLGAQYAEQLARSGYDLILVARGEDRLQALAGTLTGRFGGRCDVLPADLSTPEGLALVEGRVASDDEPVDLLVNNAGFGTKGEFLASPVESEQQMLDVNVTALMRLCHAALPGMVRRGTGGVINVASVAAFLPSDTGPGYAASKAYVVAFTDSLAVTLQGTGVHVSVVCPGFVRTEFHERIEQDVSWIPRWAWLKAPEVVATSLRDHRAGRHRSVPSVKYKSVVQVLRVVPRAALRRVLVKSRALQHRPD
ncbi:hypothetical protein CLV47_12631 [Antricoccus suffuscus]|uniref:Short-subunit dehydrogenase n=1 Tax=Antricoccus suffuscus TaxID=1629062 RepID=A0A2T0Z9C7_9ACTN|nr:SDR family oxidoreductase [Antricoccus suffuscus]PRZ32758.1 hypothetical protein CLV47_12631 [Antricoccus suffuscus]